VELNMSNDRLTSEGLELTLSNDQLKNEVLDPTLLIDRLKNDVRNPQSQFVESIYNDRCPALVM
jgi:hypothetical protein